MRLCTYKVEVRDDVVHVESPGEEGETEWELVKYEPVSEGSSISSSSSTLLPPPSFPFLWRWS